MSRSPVYFMLCTLSIFRIQLLLYLKDMSKEMISRTHQLGKEVDELGADIKVDISYVMLSGF